MSRGEKSAVSIHLQAKMRSLVEGKTKINLGNKISTGEDIAGQQNNDLIS